MNPPPLFPLRPPWAWRAFEGGAYLLEAGWVRAGVAWTGRSWDVWLARDPIGLELSVDAVRPERVHARLEQLLRQPVHALDWSPPAQHTDEQETP